jgi:transposase InsO family protein
MSREAHVRFCERLGVKLPRSTHPVSESFWKTIKAELIYREVFRTREDAQVKIFDYIEIFYNKRRLHSVLGYMSPEQFELKGQKAA